jgi:uncharacterized membrane protein YidH (DUF202 family)
LESIEAFVANQRDTKRAVEDRAYQQQQNLALFIGVGIAVALMLVLIIIAAGA